MLLRHLRYLLAVAEEGNFTRAAQTLHVSQPALSQQIRQLEERLGVQLLDRTGRAVRPTDAGEAFLIHARRALSEADAAERAARDVEDLTSGLVRVGHTPSFGAYLVAPVVRHFREHYPGIVLELSDMSQDEMETALHDDLLDLGLAFSEVRTEGIDMRPLHTEQLMLVGAEENGAMPPGIFDAAQLERQELALLGPGFATRQTVDAHLRRHGIAARIVVEATSISTIVEIVRTTSLITVLPDVLVSHLQGLSARALNPPFPARTAAVLRRDGAYLSAAARVFTNAIDAHVERLTAAGRSG